MDPKERKKDRQTDRQTEMLTLLLRQGGCGMRFRERGMKRKEEGREEE